MPSDGNTWTNFKTHFTADKINYKKARPVDTTAQHRYTNQAKIIEKFSKKLKLENSMKQLLQQN